MNHPEMRIRTRAKANHFGPELVAEHGLVVFAVATAIYLLVYGQFDVIRVVRWAALISAWSLAASFGEFIRCTRPDGAFAFVGLASAVAGIRALIAMLAVVSAAASADGWAEAADSMGWSAVVIAFMLLPYPGLGFKFRSRILMGGVGVVPGLMGEVAACIPIFLEVGSRAELLIGVLLLAFACWAGLQFLIAARELAARG